MPVKKDPSGRRSVEAETDVPGTPEEVWRTIATGPGTSAWFVPTRLEGREGGEVITDFGPGMESKATISQWDPPRRFAAENRGDVGAGAPSVATEWTVEASPPGTCRVRVVHSWVANNDDLDALYENVAARWPDYFRILALYLTHFPGQPSHLVQVEATSPSSASEVWEKFRAASGLRSGAIGERVETTVPGAPRLAGVVENVGVEHDELLLRLEEPTPGVARLFTLPMGGRTFLSIRLYLYGANAKEVAAREAPKWRAWLGELF